MAAAGLTPEDFAGDDTEVWPENWPSFRLFHDLQTQWRSNGMGLSGMDYNVLFQKLDRMDLTPAEYDEFEDDIRTMEWAALAAMNSRD